MTQKEKVLQYMKDFGRITTLQAFQDLGITRLAARINELRKDGVLIETNFINVKNRYGEKVRYAEYNIAER